MLTVNNTDKITFIWRLGLDRFSVEWHYGAVLESHLLFHWLICEVDRQETGSKLVSKNSPIMQFDTTLHRPFQHDQ